MNGAAPAPSLNGLLPSTGSAGLFGRGKKHLEDENAQLRDQIHRLLGLDATALANEAAELRGAVTLLRQEAVTLRSQVDQIRADLVRTSNEAELQEVGIYTYQHPLADAVAYKARLASLSDQIKTWARGDQAVEAATGWTVNGSLAEGKRMVKEYSKLMLRAYNAEADNCVARVQPHRLHTTIERLAKVAQTIEKLGKTMSIRIAPAYHMLRVQEIQLTADYRSKLEEEKERVREERERMREERQAALEFERERARLAKEQAHYQSALAKLVAKGDTSGAADVEEKLREIDGAIASVDAREANIRAGYVYVISNIGAFGPDMVKIGMTRRLEPDDRIRELGDASVPFRFDTHAVIFSEDAVSLESRLHAALATERVNRVNQRREFFYATPARVRELLTDIAGQHLLEYRDVPDALEWRASGARGEVNISEHSS
ncbi:DUF4041 domain-containing protein [Hamadaea sp. NPDC051192]|uniref:DUF4041 domain-containing protein n=1 Tax=Hamadaea sp. NPDC051192 TaxID=3154940 RepID=UPI0034384CE4